MTPAILNDVQISNLAMELPAHVRSNDWTRLFCMRENGVSLDTIYEKCKHSDKTIMVLRDQYGAVFGGYCTEPWDNNNCFFGDGECILFTFKKTDKVQTF